MIIVEVNKIIINYYNLENSWTKQETKTITTIKTVWCYTVFYCVTHLIRQRLTKRNTHNTVKDTKIK